MIFDKLDKYYNKKTVNHTVTTFTVDKKVQAIKILLETRKKNKKKSRKIDLLHLTSFWTFFKIFWTLMRISFLSFCLTDRKPIQEKRE